MIQTILNLSPILIFFSLGYGVKKSGIKLADIPLRINRFVIRFIFPAVILLAVPKLEPDSGVYFAVLSPWLGILIAGVCVLSLSRLLKWPREIEGALLILSALGNTGFLGVPMVHSLFGLEHLAIAVIFDQFGTFIAVTTYAIFITMLYGADEKISIIKILKNVLLFPPFLALLLALFLGPDSLTPLEPVLEIMSLCVIPLTMLSIGMQFSFRVEKNIMLPLLSGLGIKMFLLPLVIGFLGYALSISTPVLQVSIFQSATSPMVTGAILLLSHRIAPKFTASILGFGTLLSLIWLPLLFIFLNQLAPTAI